MAITIPETMPEDWFDEGARIRGCDPDDATLRQAMQDAYAEGLEALHVADIMVELRDRCRVAANPPEDASAGVEPEPDPPHDGMAV